MNTLIVDLAISNNILTRLICDNHEVQEDEIAVFFAVRRIRLTRSFSKSLG